MSKLLETFQELNLSNYGPDDVDQLNAWAIDAYAELSAIKAQEPAAWKVTNPVTGDELLCNYKPGGLNYVFQPLYAAPVSEAKAQGVVMPDVNAAAKALCNRHAMICGVDAGDQWKEYGQDFIADAETVLANACLNAAPVQQPKCKTCDDNGRIGGPSFYAPDDGGDPCPDCSAPVQQVSEPDGYARVPTELTDEMLRAMKIQLDKSPVFWCRYRAAYRAMLSAAQEAPAADAGLVAVEWAKDAEEWGPALNEAGWLFLSELNEDPQKSALIFNNTKGPLRAAIMKYAEIVTAHRAQEAV